MTLSTKLLLISYIVETLYYLVTNSNLSVLLMNHIIFCGMLWKLIICVLVNKGSDIVFELLFLFQVLYDVLLIEGKGKNLKRFIQTNIDIWIPV